MNDIKKTRIALIALGVGVVAYLLYKRRQKKLLEAPVMTTRPMVVETEQKFSGATGNLRVSRSRGQGGRTEQGR